ncbi:BTAD domain-containing putative transcriptional regulator [Streptomyces asiaticus]
MPPPVDHLRFDILGSMQARKGSVIKDCGSPQAQAFLTVLLLQPGRTATLSELINGIWGNEPPDTAVATVRTHAWKWRRFLTACDAGRDTLLSKGDGYRLVLPAPMTDVDEVETIASQAAAARSQGRLAEADALLQQALNHWYGDPLSAIPGEFAERQRIRLTEMYTTLKEERCDLQLALGRAALVVPDLLLLTAAHPLRQRAHSLLMQALHATGRQPEALAVFDKVRRALAEGHGVDPDPELVRLHQQILSGEAPADGSAESVTAERPPEPPVQSRTWPIPRQLPCDVAEYVGNEQRLSSVVAALDPSRRHGPAIVTVDGPPGAGKSSLAIHAAHQVQHWFKAGVLYADLWADDTLADPSKVLTSFLLSLGLSPDIIPTRLSDLSALFRSMTEGRELLIVLDHAHDVAHVRQLLPGSSRCAVLLTSTARLSNLSVTHRVSLGPAPTADSLGILATALGRDRVLADASAALELVRSCGRLPLVLHAIGNWLAARPQWPLEAAVQQINGSSGFLFSCCDSVVVCFEKGFRLLSPEQARAWTRLAWSSGDITPTSASRLLSVALCYAEALLEGLADTLLLEPVAHGGYRFSSLLRQFARQKYVRDQMLSWPHPAA